VEELDSVVTRHKSSLKLTFSRKKGIFFIGKYQVSIPTYKYPGKDSFGQFFQGIMKVFITTIFNLDRKYDCKQIELENNPGGTGRKKDIAFQFSGFCA
jgi:hypothetical protein